MGNTKLKNTLSKTAWIIDADTLLVDSSTGLPKFIDISNDNINITTDNAIKFTQPELPEHHLAEPVTNNTKLPTHAIDKANAIDLKLINPSELIETNFIGFRELISQLSIEQSNLFSQAIQLRRWETDHKFCSRCGSKTKIHSTGEFATVCPNCDYHQYPRIQPCVITTITRIHPQTNKPQILLAHHHRYGNPKTTNLRYGLIAGFLETGESLEQAVLRETMEEVSLAVNNIRYVDSQPWPYPSNLMVGFTAEYDNRFGNADEIKVQLEELSHAHFFDIDNLPSIPMVGSIAYRLIEHITSSHGLPAPTSHW